jgi:hypothetical protein
MREIENWGKSRDGYNAGGNYDENPQLKQFTLRKYQMMKDQGQLSRLSNLEDKSLVMDVYREANTRSQMMVENENFEIDEA